MENAVHNMKGHEGIRRIHKKQYAAKNLKFPIYSTQNRKS
jgi:hypothetical protein